MRKPADDPPEPDAEALRAELAQAHAFIRQVAGGLKALLDIPVTPHDDLQALLRREADAAGLPARCALTACRRRRACHAPARDAVPCLPLWPAQALTRFLALSDGIAFAAQCAEARRQRMAALAGPALDRWSSPDDPDEQMSRRSSRRRKALRPGRS